MVAIMFSLSQVRDGVDDDRSQEDGGDQGAEEELGAGDHWSVLGVVDVFIVCTGARLSDRQQGVSCKLHDASHYLFLVFVFEGWKGLTGRFR